MGQNYKPLKLNKMETKNTYSKYCPNVFVAKCTEQHEKGDVILLTTKYGKEHENEVHNYSLYWACSLYWLKTL